MEIFSNLDVGEKQSNSCIMLFNVYGICTAGEVRLRKYMKAQGQDNPILIT